MLLKSSEDSLCDRCEESDCNEVEFERTSNPDTCKRISLSHTASAAFRTGVSERCGVNCFSGSARTQALSRKMRISSSIRIRSAERKRN
ncbi:hypothetical protein AVEN_199415-1 [Araneus ventricosus]|uniref:Uncharacterized protein n=1 Tax=Araneus ventricosus TaxID=182803 RepID=A0A4Y2CYG3_ARAVE|nr:hypothetical protein AVEN_199415-1 [Araneus ventricosus]